MEKDAGMISTGKNSLFVYQSSLAIIRAELSSNKAGETGEEIHFDIRSISFVLRDVFVHVVRHWTDSFTSSPKEGVLRIFNGLKGPSLSACFEPANLGSNGKHANH
jgi:hypothetical protein